MSKKEYDIFVSKRNTPHLDLYTKLIGMFFFFLGTNFGLSFLYSWAIEEHQYAGCCLVLSLLMYSLISTKTKDPRRGNRGLLAVIFGGVMHAICTLGVMYVLSFWFLIIVYIIEMIRVLIVILAYSNLHKGK